MFEYSGLWKRENDKNDGFFDMALSAAPKDWNYVFLLVCIKSKLVIMLCIIFMCQ